MRSLGFTLLELLICLILISIIALIALPNWHRFVARQQLHNATQQVVTLIRHARTTSTAKGGTLVCAGQSHCEEFDRTNQLKVTANQQTYQWLKLPQPISIQWNGLHPYIKFNVQGRSVFNNGHLLICHAQLNQQASKITLNWAGRIKTETIYNADC